MPRDEATIQSLRRDLALQLSRVARHLGDTQVAAARRLGVPQPTLSKIINGRVSDLSIEFLLRVAVRAGLPVTLQTGRDAAEAGAFISGLARRSAHASGSKLAKEARESLLKSERRLTPGERSTCERSRCPFKVSICASSVAKTSSPWNALRVVRRTWRMLAPPSRVRKVRWISIFYGP